MIKATIAQVSGITALVIPVAAAQGQPGIVRLQITWISVLAFLLLLVFIIWIIMRNKKRRQ